MADSLQWKAGEGYDSQVLRKGPPSKALGNSFDIDPQFPLAQFPRVFIPHFRGAPNRHGEDIVKTGLNQAILEPFKLYAPHPLRGPLP